MWVSSSWGAALRGFVLGWGIVEGGVGKLNLSKSLWVCWVFLPLVVLASFPFSGPFFCVELAISHGRVWERETCSEGARLVVA